MPRTRHASLSLTIVVAVVLALGRAIGAAPLVPIADVAAYVGRTITVEGDVSEAHVEEGGLVLTVAPGDPKGFRIVLVLALISDLPSHPERVYTGKRIRVTGLVQRFQGRPEMVLESPSQIAVVDVAQSGAATTATTLPVEPRAAAPAPPPAPSARALPAPAVAPTPAPPPAPIVGAPPNVAPAPAPVPSTTLPAARPLLTERLAADACARARTRWQDAAETARDKLGALTRCLDATPYHCSDAAAAVAPALADLEWAEQGVAAKCD